MSQFNIRLTFKIDNKNPINCANKTKYMSLSKWYKKKDKNL